MSRLSASRAERVYLGLVSEHQSAILNYLYRLVGDADTAEDLTQETYVKAWRALERLELDEEAEKRRRAWLYRIAHNTALDHLRRKTRLRWLGLDALRGGSGDPAVPVLTGQPVRQALSALDEDHRRVLLLFNHEGLSASEVAAVLGITPAAARKRRQRAGEAFREIYRSLEERPAKDEDDDGRGDGDPPAGDGPGGSMSGGGGGRADGARGSRGMPPERAARAVDAGAPAVSCEPFRDLLAEGPLESLAAEARRRLEAHLLGCPDCREQVETDRLVAEGLAAERRLTPSRALQQALLEVPRRERRMRWLLPLMLPLAMSFCALGSWWIWGLTPGGPRLTDGQATATAAAALGQGPSERGPAERATDDGAPGEAATATAADDRLAAESPTAPSAAGASGAGTATLALPAGTRTALAGSGTPPPPATRLAIAPSLTPAAGPPGGGSGSRRPGAGRTPPASTPEIGPTPTPTVPDGRDLPGQTPEPTATGGDPGGGAPAPGETPTARPLPPTATATEPPPPEPAPTLRPTPTPTAQSLLPTPTPRQTRPPLPTPTSAPTQPPRMPTQGPPTGTFPPPTQAPVTATAPLPPTASSTPLPSPTATATITPTLTATPTVGLERRAGGARNEPAAWRSSSLRPPDAAIRCPRLPSGAPPDGPARAWRPGLPTMASGGARSAPMIDARTRGRPSIRGAASSSGAWRAQSSPGSAPPPLV